MGQANVWCNRLYDISERNNIFLMNAYKSLVFGAITLEILFISDFQAHELLLQTDAINKHFDTFPNTLHIILNTKPQVLYLNKTIQ